MARLGVSVLENKLAAQAGQPTRGVDDNLHGVPTTRTAGRTAWGRDGKENLIDVERLQ